MFQESSVCSGASQSSAVSETSMGSTPNLQNRDFKIIVEPKTPQQQCQVRVTVNKAPCGHFRIFSDCNTPSGPNDARKSSLDIRYKPMFGQRTI